jgi:8-oxo-dGTP pyrophosphatase MutT (NUDIX family)
MSWNAHVTVAAVVERAGEFLLVRERADAGIVYNQPAGHLEPGESLIEAVRRETLEETAYVFHPRALVGVYRYLSEANGITYLRFCFCGDCDRAPLDRALDTGILGAHWLNRDTLAQRADQLRSPMVLRCIDDYLSGKRFGLELLGELTDR